MTKNKNFFIKLIIIVIVSAILALTVCVLLPFGSSYRGYNSAFGLSSIILIHLSSDGISSGDIIISISSMSDIPFQYRAKGSYKINHFKNTIEIDWGFDDFYKEKDLQSIESILNLELTKPVHFKHDLFKTTIYLGDYMLKN